MSDPLHIDRVILLSTVFDSSAVESKLGHSVYSYYFVYRAFKPLLERYCDVREVDHPESRLAYAAREARSEGLKPIYLAFLPLEDLYLSADIPIVAFPFWEFPDIPSRNLGNRPRDNWLSATKNIFGILTACHFTKAAFERAGFRKSVDVVPVPIQPDYFEIPAWDSSARISVGCSWFELRPDVTNSSTPVPSFARKTSGAASRLRDPAFLIRKALQLSRAVAPRATNFIVGRVKRSLSIVSRGENLSASLAYISSLERKALSLSGIIFTSIFNPFDGRKNWTDLVTAALIAFKDRPDATLLFKLIVPPDHRLLAVEAVHDFYRQSGLQHQCRFVVISDYLSEQQMLDLAKGSAFYVNASRAEGACLPLQDFLAAGRPAVAPVHTAMQDYFDGDVGFVVNSSQEPTFWPRDPERAVTTSWARIDWSSLRDSLDRAYALAKDAPGSYRRMGDAGRQRMAGYAREDVVWAKLNAALDRLIERAGEPQSRSDSPS